MLKELYKLVTENVTFKVFLAYNGKHNAKEQTILGLTTTTDITCHKPMLKLHLNSVHVVNLYVEKQ
jgi:hypothetical protein